MTEKTLTIFSLPPEILGKIFTELPLKIHEYPNSWERCKAIPLVCREFSHVHKLHPPRERFYELVGEPSERHIAFLKWISGSVEAFFYVLQARWPNAMDAEPNQVGTMELLRAAAACPNLRDVSIQCCIYCPGVARQIGALTQIQHLSLDCWIFSGEVATDLDQLSNLQALQSVEMTRPILRRAKTADVEVWWDTLASLASLTSLAFGDDDTYAWSELSLGGIDHYRDPDHKFSASLRALTNLTSLDLLCPLPSSVVSRITRRLPALKEVSLVIDDTGLQPTMLFGTAGFLTSLTLRGYEHHLSERESRVETLIVANLVPPPVLASLKHLAMLKAGLTFYYGVPEPFPKAVAAALTDLVSLDLSDNNLCKLPQSLSMVTSLERLRVAGSSILSLEEKDLEILRALSHLKVFDIAKYPSDVEYDGYHPEIGAANKWRQEDLPIMFQMWREFSHLEMPLTLEEPSHSLRYRWLAFE